MEIKKGNIKDIDILVANRMEFIKSMRDYEVVLPERFENATYEYMKEHLSDDSMVVWLAYENDVIVSTAMVCYYRILPAMSNPTGITGYIFNVATLPEYRRKGLASLLMNKIMQDSKDRNVGKLYLKASDMGMPVYKKLGFEVLTSDMAYTLL